MVMKGRVIPIPGPGELPADLLDVSFVSLETITAGDMIYVNTSSYMGRAQANASSTMHAVGAAVYNVASGLRGPVRPAGLFRSANYDFSGYIGRIGFVSTSAAGGVQTTPPAASGQIVQMVGFMVERRALYVSLGHALQVGGAIF